MQPFTAEKGNEMEEDEANNISFENHGAKSMDLEEEEEEKNHICLECGKGFKSGKALGGHKRIHGIETQKSNMVRPKMVLSGIVGRSETGEFEVACCVCPKKFKSMKALYGHMRFHPFRGWKGVLPPPGNSSSSTLSIDDNDDDENSELLENILERKGWGKKGKRGRSSVLKDSKSEEIDITDLLILVNVALAGTLNDAETCNLYSDEDMMKKRKKKKKRKFSEIEIIPSSYTDHVAAAEEGSARARENHVCVTCNKSFPSYQALGGHRASCNKVKILENHETRAPNGEVLLLGTEDIAMGLATSQGPTTFIISSSSNNRDHICKVCHKSFSTGQALGGHMRRHWTAPSAPTVAQTSDPASGSSSKVTETEQRSHWTTPSTPTMAQTSDPASGSSSQVTEIVQRSHWTTPSAPTSDPASGSSCQVSEIVQEVKRSHWTAPSALTIAQTTDPASGSSSEVKEIAQQVKKMKRTLLDFDLNELPPNEEERV